MVNFGGIYYASSTFSIGSFEIRFYGLMYALAFFLGIELAKFHAKERGYDGKIIENYAFIAMLSGLLGGRLYYVFLIGITIQNIQQRYWQLGTVEWLYMVE